MGRKKPNAWGIHDMHGNVIEWCNDAYDAHYYRSSPEKDSRGPEEAPESKYVIRGGAWNASAAACRAARRAAEFPSQPDGCFARDDIGFRCVRNGPATDRERFKKQEKQPQIDANGRE